MNNCFMELVNVITTEHVYIQTHNFPDPDAISSAFGLHKLLESRGIASTICYKGKIDRHSTMRMVEILNIPIVNLDELDNIEQGNEVILVDAQKGNSNVIDMIGNEIACIDHHPTFEDATYKFSDIRPEVGACASIIASYFYENDIEMPDEVATALVYGMRVDTANLSRGVSKFDLDMFYKLYGASDKALVNSLEHNSIHYGELQAYANAINAIKVYDDVSITNAGKGCPDTLIATVSDFILSLVEIKFSIVYSIREDGVKLSLRNEKSGLDAGKIAYAALAGLGTGGGHQTMAGGFVPFKDFSVDESKKVKLLIDTMEERFLETIANYK